MAEIPLIITGIPALALGLIQAVRQVRQHAVEIALVALLALGLIYCVAQAVFTSDPVWGPLGLLYGVVVVTRLQVDRRPNTIKDHDLGD